MGEDGGVTLKLDADTARYIAGIAKAAEANKQLIDQKKKLGVNMKELTDQAGEFARHVVGWSGPLTAAAAGIYVLDKATEQWSKKLQSAKDAMNEIADLSGSIIAGGRGHQVDAIRSAIDAGAPGLNGGQKNAFFKGYNAANPTASMDDIRSAAGAANTVGLLGRDVGSFAGLQGSLQRSGVANSGDLANYLQTYAGDGADKAASLIAKNPGQATQIAQLFATAQRGGKGTSGLLDRASADFAARGGTGNFSDSLNGRVAGAGGADDLAYLLNPANAAPAFKTGGLDAAMQQAMADPDLATRIKAKIIREQGQDAAYAGAGSRARASDLGSAFAEKQGSGESTVGHLVRNFGWLVPSPVSALSPVTNTNAWMKNVASEESLNERYLKEIADQTKAPVVAPRLRRQGEESR